MKQLSIYDHEYLNDFDTTCKANIEISSRAAWHKQTARPNKISSTIYETDIHQEKNETHEQKAFPANVTEIVLTKNKIDSIELILPMLINLHQEKRWLAWIDPPIQLLKEWQKTHNNSALNDIMILRSNDNLSVFELSKRALTAGTCHAVIAWTNSLSQDEFSKLEIASSRGNSHGIILKSRLQLN